MLKADGIDWVYVIWCHTNFLHLNASRSQRYYEFDSVVLQGLPKAHFREIAQNLCRHKIARNSMDFAMLGMRGSWLWLTLVPISNFNRFNTPVQTIVEQWIPASKNGKGKKRRYNMSRMRTLDLNCHTNPCGLTQGPALHMPPKTHTKGTIEFRVTKLLSIGPPLCQVTKTMNWRTVTARALAGGHFVYEGATTPSQSTHI